MFALPLLRAGRLRVASPVLRTPPPRSDTASGFLAELSGAPVVSDRTARVRGDPLTGFERMFEHRGMAAVVPAPAQRARPETVGRSEGDRPLPVLPALEPLFATGGLRRGSAVTVRGSASLLLALLAGPSGRGAWCGVVGVPGLGLAAAAEAGIALERLALVPDPGRDWAAVAAALLDAMEVVVVAPRGRVPDADVRRLAARARQRGAVLVPFGPVPWPGAELRLSLVDGVWEGLGDGS